MSVGADSQLESERSASNIAGKYLTFSLSDGEYGVSILRVLEIFGVPKITRVPGCPEYVKGVINLRGKIIPVVDLRLKFGLDPIEYDHTTCVIVVNVTVNGSEIALGTVVDTVLEVRDFDADSLAPAPDFGQHLPTDFILAMGKHSSGKVTILTDVDKIFLKNETEAIAELSETPLNATGAE